MNRRKFIAGATGTATAATLGGIALTGSAAAEMTVQTSESGDGETVSVTTNDGDVSEVSISPTLDVSWDGFDEAAEEIRFLVEAKLASEDDSAYTPVLRETPWLYNEDNWPENQHSAGTSDTFSAPIFSRASDFADDSTDWTADSVPQSEIPHIVLYTDADYDVPDYPEDHENGTNVGGTPNPDDLVNGKYGIAGDTSAFDQETDGETTTTDVTVRYTVSLHTSEEYSPLVMSGDGDEYADLLDGTDPGALTYAETRAIAPDHPAVEVVTDTFTVEAQNIPSTADGTVTTNANAE